ncbi:MAG: response regulator [Candidatus Binataceae bacterium]|nr:response regulator [Candidatus Binataceae bacterium]
MSDRDPPPEWLEHSPGGRAPSAFSTGRRILIVDDEPDLAESCARLLGLKGHECFRAHGQLEAMTMIDQLVPDLVVTDLYLSDGDGLAVARHARRRIRPLPVILMTAYHSPDAVAAAAEVGAVDYLLKPFSMAELDRAVNAAIAPDPLPVRAPHG